MLRFALGVCLIFGAIWPTIGTTQESEAVTFVLADLNGDGLEERFDLVAGIDGATNLVISNTGLSDILAPEIATTGLDAEPPLIEVLGDGQIRVTSHHDTNGAIRWTLGLTIGFPDGSYRVTGYTFIWWNPVALDEYGLCDLNLRTGTGVLQVGEGEAYAVDVVTPALPVTIWSTTDKVLPVDCL
jgi:hypothetical protein